LALPKSADHLFQFSSFEMILECNDFFENFIFHLVFLLEFFWKLWLLPKQTKSLQTNLASKSKLSLLLYPKTFDFSYFLQFWDFPESLVVCCVLLNEIGENCDAFLGLPKSAVHLFQFSAFGIILEWNDFFENFIFDLVFVLEIFWKLWLLQTNLASKPRLSLLFHCTQKPSIFLNAPSFTFVTFCLEFWTSLRAWLSVCRRPSWRCPRWRPAAARAVTWASTATTR
jgi:hypothetical protein